MGDITRSKRGTAMAMIPIPIERRDGLVNVIRCKDCKNWDTKRTLVFMCYCSELNRWTGDDYYCASGERKEEENNEIS